MNTFFYNFFIDDNKSGHKTRESHLLNKYPDIHKKIIDFCDNEYLEDLPFKIKVWHFINNQSEIPKCGHCGKNLKFKRSLVEGYGLYCSVTCTNKSKNHINKVKESNKEKYGGTSPMHSDEIKNKVKTTNLKKYGVENTFQRLDMVENGFLKNHGVKHVSEVNGVLEKRRLTNIEKYGEINNLNRKDILSRTHKTRRKYFLERYGDHDFNIYTGHTLNVVCSECNNNYTINRNSFRYRVSINVNPCTICNPINDSSSIQEKELQKIIASVVGEDNCVLNDRNIISPKELDIVIPNKNLAIEYNGVYWHNELFVDKDYHLKKFLNCKSKGVDLIQVFQDEWENKRDIVLSLIKNRLGLNKNNIIYARKCEIRVVNNKDHNKFLNNNHVQGKVGASVKLGLYYNNELVSLMTFGKLRKSLGSSHIDGEWELIRFCNKLNHNVVGGASKLFKYFVKNYEPTKILSFSDNRFFNGEMYKLLGFNYDGYSKPSYFYVINGVRHHRYNFRKDVLVRDGFDKNKTEHQIMLDRGIYRVYDCGNKRWSWVDQTKKNI